MSDCVIYTYKISMTNVDQHFYVRFWGGEGVKKKRMICMRPKMSVIMNDP